MSQKNKQRNQFNQSKEFFGRANQSLLENPTKTIPGSSTIRPNLRGNVPAFLNTANSNKYKCKVTYLDVSNLAKKDEWLRRRISDCYPRFNLRTKISERKKTPNPKLDVRKSSL